HIYEGMHAFELYLEKMRPGDPVAQHELLRLYVRSAYNVEAVRVADDLLAKNPRDAEALHMKAWALTAQHKPEQALIISKRLNEIDPMNMNGQLFTLALMSQLHVAGKEMIDYADAQRKTHEKDPRFEML